MEQELRNLLKQKWSVIEQIVYGTLDFFKLALVKPSLLNKENSFSLVDQHGKLILKLTDKISLLFLPPILGNTCKVELYCNQLDIDNYAWKSALEAKYPDFEFLAISLGIISGEILDLSAYIEPINQEKLTAMQEEIRNLQKELDALKKRPATVVHHRSGGGGGRIIKYGLPDAPRAHLLVFSNGEKLIIPDEETVNAWINDPSKEQPVEIWQLKKRTIVPA